MKPIDFPEANFTYTVSEEMKDKVQPMRCMRAVEPDGTPIAVTKWEFEQWEIDMIVKHKSMYSVVVGEHMQPMNLFTQNPFTVKAQIETIKPKIIGLDGKEL